MVSLRGALAGIDDLPVFERAGAPGANHGVFPEQDPEVAAE